MRTASNRYNCNVGPLGSARELELRYADQAQQCQLLKRQYAEVDFVGVEGALPDQGLWWGRELYTMTIVRHPRSYWLSKWRHFVGDPRRQVRTPLALAVRMRLRRNDL